MRIFVGLELSNDMRTEAARIARIAQARMPGKYVAPDNYHCTLAYVSEADETLCALVKGALDAAAQGMPPACALGEAGFFHKPQRAILYLGLQRRESLMQAADTVRDELKRLNISFDPDAFTPHITLARGVLIDQAGMAALTPGACSSTIPCLTLFESARVDGALRYTPIYRVRWGGK